jgi:hypothetical protein
MGRRGPQPMSAELQALRGFPSKRKPRPPRLFVIEPAPPLTNKFAGLMPGSPGSCPLEVPPSERAAWYMRHEREARRKSDRQSN